MKSISIAELLLVIYVIVDDWYLIEGQIILQGKPGRKPEFTDSEMITLMLAQDFIHILEKISILATSRPIIQTCFQI